MFGIQWITNIVLRDVKGEIFAKGTKAARFLASLLDKKVENLNAPRFLILSTLKQMKKCGFARFSHSDTNHSSLCRAQGEIAW